jgi:hypothetical protein
VQGVGELASESGGQQGQQLEDGVPGGDGQGTQRTHDRRVGPGSVPRRKLLGVP